MEEQKATVEVVQDQNISTRREIVEIFPGKCIAMHDGKDYIIDEHGALRKLAVKGCKCVKRK